MISCTIGDKTITGETKDEVAEALFTEATLVQARAKQVRRYASEQREAWQKAHPGPYLTEAERAARDEADARFAGPVKLADAAAAEAMRIWSEFDTDDE
jgi:hypothetical protein